MLGVLIVATIVLSLLIKLSNMSSHLNFDFMKAEIYYLSYQCLQNRLSGHSKDLGIKTQAVD